MSNTAPLRLVSTTTVPRRTHVREIEQPVISITLQADDRRVLTVAEAGHALGISRSKLYQFCLLYTSPSPRDRTRSRMPSSA